MSLERATIAERQGASEEQKFIAKMPQSNMNLFFTNGIRGLLAHYMSTSSIFKSREFIPQFFSLWKTFSSASLKKDLIAGVTVAFISLPLAIGFAIASGAVPSQGLYTAIVSGFLVSLLGGSRVQISGPAGAFIPIIFAIIQQTGYHGLAISTMIAAGILILMGLARMGSWIQKLPESIILGFTTGIAFTIFASQLPDFSGNSNQPFVTTLLGTSAAACMLAIRRFYPSYPWAMIGIVVASILAALFHLPVDTIYSRFGDLPSSLPMPAVPSFTVPAGMWGTYLMNAISIAVLAAIESLLCAKIADRMIQDQHRSNCELIAHGIGNFFSIVFGGLPATGVIARTSANVKSGAQTPVAGIAHALALLMLLACCASLVGKIPMTALAAVLMIVSWNMWDKQYAKTVLTTASCERAVFITTCLLTILTNLIVAVVAGILVHITYQFLFVKNRYGTSQPPL